jgi:hypothetical protein
LHVAPVTKQFAKERHKMLSKSSECPRNVSNSKTVSWEDLVAIEPKLNDLLMEARSIKDEGGPYICGHEILVSGWKDHPSFKKRLHKLVGWGSKRPGSILATEQAYYKAIITIENALPSCRNCGCIREDGSII